MNNLDSKLRTNRTDLATKTLFLLALVFVQLNVTSWCNLAIAQSPSAAKVAEDQSVATAVQIQLLSGVSLEAEIFNLSSDSVTVLVKSGNAKEKKSFAISEVSNLKFLDSVPAVSSTELDVLKLSDGSVIRCSAVAGKDNDWSVEAGCGIKFVAKPSMLASLQFRMLSKTIVAAIDEKGASPPVTDEMLIVRPGDTVDRISGVILGLDKESVSFSFDGQTIPAPRSKLAGLLWTQPAESSFQPTIKIRTRDGSKWEATTLNLSKNQDGNRFTWKLRSGPECECSAEEIASIDYSNAIVRWIAAISSIESKAYTNPLLASPITGRAAMMAPYFLGSGGSGNSVDEPSSQNLVFPVDGFYVVRVPEGVSKFRSRIVRPADAKIQGKIKCEVWSNDDLIWSNKDTSLESQWVIDLVVNADKKLKLVVESDSGVSVGSMVTWVQPRFSP